MIPIVSIVGKSDSGKTTLIEKLVPELKIRGYRVATIKHDAHTFEIDHKGKDSWRHKNSGAALSIISSATKIAVIRDSDEDLSLAKLREKFVDGVDIILSEGYKRETHPKIEVFRSEMKRELLCKADDNLVAIAGDPQDAPEGIPVYGINDAKGLCDFIERTFLKN